MRSFASDNNSSVHPRIMEALMKTNNGHALGYGDDPWTEEATHKVNKQPREMGEMTLKDFVPMSLRCQMRSNRKSGKCKEKQNIAGERFANHYPRRCKI